MWAGQDRRAFGISEDRYQRCVSCDKELVVLPNDRRRGYCFDCLSLLDQGLEACPRCHASLGSDNGTLPCPSCGTSFHS